LSAPIPNFTFNPTSISKSTVQIQFPVQHPKPPQLNFLIDLIGCSGEGKTNNQISRHKFVVLELLSCDLERLHVNDAITKDLSDVGKRRKKTNLDDYKNTHRILWLHYCYAIAREKSFKYSAAPPHSSLLSMKVSEDLPGAVNVITRPPHN
jgi:hypothetical protein